MITIKKQEIVKLEDVLHLYQAVGWTNYTHNQRCWSMPYRIH